MAGPVATKRPGFSRSYARIHGPEEAVVMRFMAYHIRRAISTKRNRRGGKYWYYNPLRVLAEKLPFPRSTVSDILDRLVAAGQIERANHNKLSKLDKTWWYTAPQEVLDAVEEDVIYFRWSISNRYGLCAGVLYENIRYRLRDQPQFWVKVLPTTMSRLIPWSKDTIRDTLDKLVAERVIVEDNATAGYYHLNMAQPGANMPDSDWLEDSETPLENPDNSEANSDNNTL